MKKQANDLSQRAERLRQRIPQLLKAVAQKAPYLLQAAVEAHMDENGPEPGAWSSSLQIGMQSGDLSRSLIPNEPGNIFEVKTDGGKLSIRYGTKIIYASVHEHGGFIRSKGKMHKWFWARYKETHAPFYKIMALSVKKRGGVRIPKRPFFEPGMEQFRKEGLSKLLQELLVEITKAWDGK